MLSVGPVRPLSMAASLGGARMDDDCWLQANSLNEVFSVEACAAANRHETCCERLDNFDWVVPPYDLAMMLPRPELDDDSSDVERDVCDVPDEFPVSVDKTAVEPLGLPVIIQMRPQVGCDPDFESSDIGRNVCDVPDEFPVCIDKMAVEPLGLLVVVQTRPQVGCDPDFESADVEQDVCHVPDEFPVGIDKAAVEPLCLPVVVQTRPQVGCDPDLPLPVDKGKESLVADGPDVIVSGRMLNVKISDVSRGICAVPDQFLVVVPKTAVEPLVLPVVVMTRSQAGCAPALTLPVDEEKNSQVEVGPDMLSGRVMDMGDPDVECSNQVLLDVVPFVDGDGCPAGCLETKFDNSVMEKFVLVTIGSTRSAVVPTFLPALSEVCSLAVLAGWVVAAANPLAVVESGTARVSVLPDVGSEFPTIYVGNGALDVVGLRVGQSSLRMDWEETLPALQDE